MSDILAHDLFAGAGGTSTGATQAGIRVVIAANHWPLAVEVHNANHPNTDHDCADISQVDPRRYPRAHILLASPECTWHSPASGRPRPAADQPLPLNLGDDEPPLPPEAGERSRATMWDVPRFAEVHHYHAIIVENVVEVTKWTPWRSWLDAMHALGYEHEVVSHNSMHAQLLGLPAPQSRDRVYIVFWRKGSRRPDLDRAQRPQAWCPRCEVVVESRKAWKPSATDRIGKYRQQYVYVCSHCGSLVEPGWLPAAAAIDWSLQGERIGDRDKPLSPKTMARIRAGLRRYAHEFVVEAAGQTYDAADPRHPRFGDPDAYYRAWSALDPLKTVHTTASKALLVPTEGRDGKTARSVLEAMRTQTTRAELGIVTTLRGQNAPKLTTHPLDTVSAGGNHHGLLIPSGGTWHEDAYSAAEAMRTVTTRENHGLLMPYYGASESARTTREPVGTITTSDRYALIMRNNTGSAEMVTPATEPIRTVTTTGHQSVLEPASLSVEDCSFRMLQPHEAAAAMAFPPDYIWRGTKRERVKLAGNAVTPPVERDIASVIVEALSAA